jgi:peptidoglycan/LPS O-acetylase OafA/YrhL
MHTQTSAADSSVSRLFPSGSSSTWMPRKLSVAASASLDVTRAIAACAVMFGHLRTLFFVDFQHLGSKTWYFEGLYFLTGFGHQAVMVFFVLSGFLISATVIRSHVAGQWSWRDYAINRATRLYVVLIPGLLLGLLWDGLGSWLYAAQGLYSHPIQDLGYDVPLRNLTPPVFLGNLFFLQTIVCRTFGSNGPLWSLANEFWYYVLFPVGLSAGLAWARRRIGAAVILTIFAAGICFFTGHEIFIGFFIWLSGCGLVFLYARTRIASRGLLLACGLLASILLCAALYAARMSWLSPLRSDLIVGFAFAASLYMLLQSSFGENSPRYATFARDFAGFSYSLYVLHFPFLLFLRASFVPEERWQPTSPHLLKAGVAAAVCLLFAWSVSLFTERRTSDARKVVRHLIA